MMMMTMMRMNKRKVSKYQTEKTANMLLGIFVALLGYRKTPAVPIPTPPAINQQTQSLPQQQSEINFRIDPPIRIDSGEFDYLYNHNQYSSAPLP